MYYMKYSSVAGDLLNSIIMVLCFYMYPQVISPPQQSPQVIVQVASMSEALRAQMSLKQPQPRVDKQVSFQSTILQKALRA